MDGEIAAGLTTLLGSSLLGWWAHVRAIRRDTREQDRQDRKLNEDVALTKDQQEAKQDERTSTILWAKLGEMETYAKNQQSQILALEKKRAEDQAKIARLEERLTLKEQRLDRLLAEIEKLKKYPPGG